MGSWVWIGFLAFFVASLSVGVRLLVLWRRTRQLPELLIGIGVLGIGPVGFGAILLGTTLVGAGVVAPDTPLGQIPFALGSLTIVVGVFAVCIFNWRVYHPERRAIALLVAIIGMLLAGLCIHQGLTRGYVPAERPEGLTLLQSSLQVGALLWGSLEALRYWWQMRRREALGLADPVVTNRFLLWGIGAGAAGLGTAVGVVASVVTSVPPLQIPWVVASSSAHGMLAAVAMWLAFLAPSGYLRWVGAGHGRAAVGGAG